MIRYVTASRTQPDAANDAAGRSDRFGFRNPVFAVPLAWCWLAAVAHGAANPFYMGADISLATFMQQQGVVFKDNGAPKPMDQILYDRGANLFRLRIFVNPQTVYTNTNFGAIQTQAYDIALAQQIKAHAPGAKLLLDFHYSDTWADPGQQTKPAAWNTQTLSQLQTTVRNYTAGTLLAFKDAGVMPDMVQVGNEIKAGMLWNTGRINFSGTTSQQRTSWQNFGLLLNSAILGVRDAQGSGTKIDVAVHIDQGDQDGHPQYFFGNLTNPTWGNVSDFDIVGVSYYPSTAQFHSFALLQSNLNAIADTYPTKKIMILETNYPWNNLPPNNLGISQWPKTPAGQQQFLTDLRNMMQNLHNGAGAGIVYWYPESVPVPGYNIYNGGATALFDANGNSLPALSTFFSAKLRGDFNGDGHFNSADVSAMMNALADLNTYRTNNGLTNPDLVAIADFNNDQLVSNADLAGMLAILKGGGGSTAAVPEPAAWWILALGARGCAGVAKASVSQLFSSTFDSVPMRRTSPILLLLVAACFESTSFGQTVCSIDVRQANQELLRGHLKLGGKNERGENISFTSRYMEQNGQPVLPVIGEFHYVRYPQAYWEESLQKMKAGGISIVATYVFWNIHEEVEGQFNWSESRDLRRFIELCAKNRLPVIVRIGPFCHGEIRNGGLPDWLYGRPFNVRSNDSAYLNYVERLYREIGKQLDGLLFKDSGPVIGIQLENEYQHSAAPWAFSYPNQPAEWTVADNDRYLVLEGVGSQKQENRHSSEGRKHMTVLKELAVRAGLEVPLYTATGWGNAAIIDDGCVPVTSAYPYPTWAKAEPSPLYLYKDLHAYPDYPPVSYQALRYPSFGAELGGGIMVTYARRPTVPARSLEALIVRELGSGANALGYYMYHGGSTPRRRNSFFSDEAAGVPKINYDFQAPIGQYGQLAESFGYLKLVHFFTNDFGSRLAPLVTVLPADATKRKPSDVDSLRFAARTDGDCGFVCLHNFQDHVPTRDLADLQLSIRTNSKEIRIPQSSTLTLKSETSALLPFNIDFEGIRVNYATAQPLARLAAPDMRRVAFVAVDGMEPEFAIDLTTARQIHSKDCRITSEPSVSLVRCPTDRVAEFVVENAAGEQVTFAVFPKSLALRAWRIAAQGRDHLLFSESTLLQKADVVEMHSLGSSVFSFSAYPKLQRPPRHNSAELEDAPSPHPSMSAHRLTTPTVEPIVHAKVADRRTLTLSTGKSTLPENVNDVFAEIDYTGDVGMAFMNGEMIDDHFYFGQPWRIGLKRFFPKLSEHGMYVSLRPLRKDAPFLPDLPARAIPDFSQQREVLRINRVDLKPEYRAAISL